MSLRICCSFKELFLFGVATAAPASLHQAGPTQNKERIIDTQTQRIIHAANAILWLWNELLEEAKTKEPNEAQRCWYRQDARQAYQNAMNAMRANGLIEDFDVLRVRCKVQGAWSDARQTFEFVPHT